jgi:hypothetical protein
MKAKHVALPDEPPEFYEMQNSLMMRRYQKKFDRWGLNWRQYYQIVPAKLKHSPYYIWIYLVGLTEMMNREQILDDELEHLEEDRDRRCWSIVGEYVQERRYVKSLNGELF